MNFDVNSLIASFFVSSVGFVLLVYGKKMGRVPHFAPARAGREQPRFDVLQHFPCST